MRFDGLAEMTGADAGSIFTTSSIIACMIDGTPAMTKTFFTTKPGATETELGMSFAPAGMRAMRRRLSFGSMPRPFQNGISRSTARWSMSIGSIEGLGDASAVMSSCVGPMPPLVKTKS